MLEVFLCQHVAMWSLRHFIIWQGDGWGESVRKGFTLCHHTWNGEFRRNETGAVMKIKLEKMVSQKLSNEFKNVFVWRRDKLTSINAQNVFCQLCKLNLSAKITEFESVNHNELGNSIHLSRCLR